MKKVVAFLLFVMLIAPLSGCSNTANGAGQDLENMGRWIQDTV